MNATYSEVLSDDPPYPLFTLTSNLWHVARVSCILGMSTIMSQCHFKTYNTQLFVLLLTQIISDPQISILPSFAVRSEIF